MTKLRQILSPKTLKILVIAGLVLLVASLTGFLLYTNNRQKNNLRPYFTYTAADISALAKLSTPSRLSVDDLYEWDRTAFQLVGQHKIGDVDASRIYAYLLVAQRDQAALALAAKGSYVGDIDVVSRDVLCLFFPDDCADFPKITNDPFSQAASQLVLARVRDRIAADLAQTKPYPLKNSPDLWHGPAPQIGIDAGSRKPWYLAHGNQFRVVPPPSAAAYRDLLAEVKHQLDTITLDQRETVVYWAGGPGTKTPPGIWLDIADRYMRPQTASLETVLQVHSDMGTAMADAVIAVFDSKYTYQKKRPYMLDPTIKTVMPTPNHPSYPAGHATISGAAAAILVSHFPANATEWNRLGQQASVSRTWGGIHFTIDNTVGYALGQKAAAETLKQEHPK